MQIWLIQHTKLGDYYYANINGALSKDKFEVYESMLMKKELGFLTLFGMTDS